MTVIYEVVLTEDAQQDIQELYDYIAEHDAPAKADYFLGRIEKLLASLANMPERGAWTKELLALGIREYRETYFKPYRVIYRVIQSDKRCMVYVYLIVDGRRDMQALLQRRMLRA
jgi:toxin ParE1/3/4